MKNPTNDLLTIASDELVAGTPMKVVLSTPRDEVDEEGNNKLTYSQVWLFHTRRAMDPAEYITAAFGTEGFNKAIAEGRAKGESWGYLAVRANRPEGSVRKAYAEATAIKSQGLRVGKGGRFLDRDPLLYLEEHKKAGTAIPVGTPRADYRKFAVMANEESLEIPELRRRLGLLGRSTKGSRSVLVKRLTAAQSPANA